MAPNPYSDTELLQRGVALLKESLPPTWQVQKLGESESDPSLGDAVLNIGSTQWNVRVVVEIKRTFGPKDVAGVVRDAPLLNTVSGNIPVLMITPQLNDR